MKNKKTKTKSEAESWSSGIKVLERMEVIVPVKLLIVCNHIAGKVRGDEFSIVTNIKEKDDTELFLSEEFYIPKQEVSASYVKYLPDTYEYNVVIHRHPDGFDDFSGTDNNYINQNFELSLLYTKRDGFVNGVYNLKLNDYLIPIPVKVYIDYGIEDLDLSNIQKPEPVRLIETIKPAEPKTNKQTSVFDSDWDLNNTEPKKSPMLPEETMDYGLMRDYLLEEINEQIAHIEYRLDNLENNQPTPFSSCGF